MVRMVLSALSWRLDGETGLGETGRQLPAKKTFEVRTLKYLTHEFNSKKKTFITPKIRNDEIVVIISIDIVILIVSVNATRHKLQKYRWSC